MINGYSIKRVNGVLVLYLYFDFNYEFSRDDFIRLKDNIRDSVSDFIKRNKIDFKGTTVLLMSGGILFGSVYFNTPSFSSVSMVNPVSISEVVSDVSFDNDVGEAFSNASFDQDFFVRNIEQVKEVDSQVEKNGSFSDVKQEKFQVKEDFSQGNVNDTSGSEFVDVSSNVVNEPVYEVKHDVLHVDEVQNEVVEPVDNNIYISLRRNGVVDKIELEEYVIGVVGAEMPASFSLDALKAQAIIARTYALKANQRGSVLSDNESSQSYKSNDELHSMWGSSYSTYFNKIKSAVDSTRGMYLSYKGSFIDAVYHSTSNGRTESSVDVWGNYYPYLVSVSSVYDDSNPSFSKSVSFSYDELSNKLGFSISSDSEFVILDRTSGDRVKSFSVDGNVFSGIDFRSKLGLRSADFDVDKGIDGVVITTRGYGHGVGLSQYGANGMAKNGFSYVDILKHYYSGVSIESL